MLQNGDEDKGIKAYLLEDEDSRVAGELQVVEPDGKKMGRREENDGFELGFQGYSFSLILGYFKVTPFTLIVFLVLILTKHFLKCFFINSCAF